MKIKPVIRWGVLWRSESKRNGKDEHILCHWHSDRRGLPALFVTRQEARDWIAVNYAYIRYRPDLRAEPYGWKVPVPVRVRISLNPGG